MIGRADSSVTHDEDDITIISYMVRVAGASVICMLCDDSDVPVYWMWKKQVKCHVQYEKSDHTVLDVNSTVAALGAKCQDLLGMYALSRSDTVSFPCGKGKLTALKVTLNNAMGGKMPLSIESRRQLRNSSELTMARRRQLLSTMPEAKSI